MEFYASPTQDPQQGILELVGDVLLQVPTRDPGPAAQHVTCGPHQPSSAPKSAAG